MAAIARVAVVGLGAAGGYVLRGIQGIPGACCVAGFDRRGHAAPSADGVTGPVSDDLRDLHRIAALDLVVVATPTPDHAATARIILTGLRPPTRLWIEKPMAATRSEHNAVRGLGSDTIQVLLHAAYSPEVLWAVEQIDGWVGEHGPLSHIEAEFDDPYAPVVTDRCSVLGDSWTDSGINALSVVARFVDTTRFIRAGGSLPLTARAAFAGLARGHDVSVAITTRWTSSSAEKKTMLRLADGTMIRLDHRTATAEVSDPDRTEVQLHHLGQRSLGDRYAAMLASYADNDHLMLTTQTQDGLHDHLYAVAEELGSG